MASLFLSNRFGIQQPMSPPVIKYEFCCGILPIFAGVFAIVFHSIVHGVFGISLILTSYYRQRSDIVNYSAVTGFIVLCLTGVAILWFSISIKQSAIKFCAILLIFVTLFNFTCSIVYFLEYYPFRANALLDRMFLWRYGTTWVTQNEFPFAIWHIFAALLIIVTPVWFYYCYVMFMFIKYINLRQQDEGQPETIVLPDRTGPLPFRTPRTENYTVIVEPPMMPKIESEV